MKARIKHDNKGYWAIIPSRYRPAYLSGPYPTLEEAYEEWSYRMEEAKKSYRQSPTKPAP